MFCRSTLTSISSLVVIIMVALVSIAGAQDAPDGNQPPSISELKLVNPRIHRGVDIQLEAVASDPDDDEISFTYQWFINGTEVEDNNTPVLAGDQFKRDDKISVKVTPNDGLDDGEVISVKEFIIPNASPVLSTEATPTFVEDRLDYQVSASDPDGDPLSFSLSGGPQGMTIDAKSGRINWVKDPAAQGTYNINIIVDDGFGGKISASFSMSL